VLIVWQVNLKPIALKNELNAALHFIKFVKRSRNLAVTDPTFNATLENTKDIISTFQVITDAAVNVHSTDYSSRLSVCLCLSVRGFIFQTTRPIFTELFFAFYLWLCIKRPKSRHRSSITMSTALESWQTTPATENVTRVQHVPL